MIILLIEILYLIPLELYRKRPFNTINMPIFNRFFSSRKSFQKEIEQLDSSRNISLINALKSNNDETSFLSTISEVRFGLFFDKLSETMKYNSKFAGSKTPDWNIKINGQTIIAEVARINPDNELKKNIDFSDLVMNSIMEIKKRYWVHVDFDDEHTPKYNIDTVVLKRELSDWLNIPRCIGESFLFD